MKIDVFLRLNLKSEIAFTRGLILVENKIAKINLHEI